MQGIAYDGHFATTDGQLTSIFYVFVFPFQLSIFFGGLGLKHLQHLFFNHGV